MWVFLKSDIFLYKLFTINPFFIIFDKIKSDNKELLMKVAVPVKDEGLEVVTRTGRAPFFAVFEVDEKTFRLLSLEPNAHSHEEHGEHHHEEHTEDEIESHRRHLRGLIGCDYILTLALGPNMKDALIRENITPVKVDKKDGKTATELLEKFISGYFSK